MWPNLDVIGWYSAKSSASLEAAGDEPTAQDIALIKGAMTDLCDNPLLLIMNRGSKYADQRKQIPFFLYEKGAQHAEENGSPFVKLSYSLASEDSEQIAVDCVAKAVDPNAKTSALGQQMAAPINAVKILRSKLAFLIKVVKESPEVRQN